MDSTLRHPPQYVKAIWAAVTTFLSGLLVALVSLQESGVENPNPGMFGWIAWLTIIGSTLAAFGGVYGLKNATPSNIYPDETADEINPNPPFPDLEP